MSQSTLAARLLDIGALRLLYGLGGDDARGVWDEAGQEPLSDLALDPTQSTEARFLAAELLADRAPEWVPTGSERAIADLYVKALMEQVVPANSWGLPGTVGPAGEHFLALGDVVNEALLPALGDGAPVAFSGSREVSAGRRAKWRVSDVAAALLASASGRQFPADETPARRDTLIAQFQEVAGSETA